MVDCKKCLHAPVCEKLPKMPGAMVAECDDLKDRTKWVERPKGYWIDKPTGAYGKWQSWCSVCGKHSGIGGIESNRHKDFCPSCGADMRGESDGNG